MTAIGTFLGVNLFNVVISEVDRIGHQMTISLGRQNKGVIPSQKKHAILKTFEEFQTFTSKIKLINIKS